MLKNKLGPPADFGKKILCKTYIYVCYINAYVLQFFIQPNLLLFFPLWLLYNFLICF